MQYSVPCTAQTTRVIAYEGKCRFLYSAVFSPLHCSNNEGDSMHMKVNVGSYMVQYSVPRTAQTMRVIAYEGKCRFLYSAVFSPLHCSNNEGDSMHMKVNVGSYIVQYSVPCTAQTTKVIACI